MANPELMAKYCSKCMPIRTGLLRDCDLDHQPSLAALKAWARQCPFCDLIWNSLVSQCDEKAIATHLDGHVYASEHLTDTAIRLRGEFHDFEQRTPEQGIRESWIHVYSGIDGSSGISGYNTQVFGKLRLFAKRGESLPKYFPGREIATRPDSEDVMSTIKIWLTSCSEGHNCGYLEQVPLPTRLIDTEPLSRGENPLLVETADKQGYYIALSYCWGLDQTYKTTGDTLDAFRTSGIDLAKMSRCAQVALKMCQSLGSRFIWIDAFCIIQKQEGIPDSDADFKREGLKMAQYYGNAQLTIIAGNTGDSNISFLQERRQSLVKPCPVPFSPMTYETWDGPQEGLIYAELPSPHTLGPIQQRAWTFQEDILSPRQLVFGTHQMAYKCKQGEFWEDGTSLRATFTPSPSELYTIRPKLAARALHTGVSPADRENVLRQWYSMLETYSRRERGNGWDKMTAIAGITQYMHSILGSRYIFGVWEDDLTRGLLWRQGWLPGDGHPMTFLQRPTAFHAPSWSWASVEGPLYQNFSEREMKMNFAQNLVDISVSVPGPEAHHFDPARAGLSLDTFRLTVQGTLKHVRVLSGPVQPAADRRSPRLPFRMRHLMVNLGAVSCDSATSDHVVAVATRDTNRELPDRSFCVRFSLREGLWLEQLGSGDYRRLGMFLVRDPQWFDHAQAPEVVNLV